VLGGAPTVAAVDVEAMAVVEDVPGVTAVGPELEADVEVGFIGVC